MKGPVSVDMRMKIVVQFLILALGAVFLAVVVAQPWIEPKWLFLDAQTAGELSGDCCHVYYGAVSNLGIMLWMGTAAICLFSGLVLFLLNGRNHASDMALSAGILSAVLGLDDAFLVHEVIAPELGIAQNLVLAVYGLLALGYAVFARRFIFGSDLWVFCLGGGALALSLGIDVVFHSVAPLLVYLEDSAKFFGITCWFLYHSSVLLDQLVPQKATPPQPGT